MLVGFYLFGCLFLTSCVDARKISYFRDIPDTTSKVILHLPTYKSPVIKKDDLIFISIQTIDPAITKLLNAGNVSSFSMSNNSNVNSGSSLSNNTGYLVDENGEVEIPIVGKIKISELTTAEAKNLIKKSSENFFKDATVDVRFANFQITVIGEVNKPSNFIVPNERITLLEAIGMAGDLTVYGKRNNILLIRHGEDDDRSKTAVRLNLNSKSLFSSPYYYLRPKDIIYVETNKSKVASTDLMQAKYITIATSFLSLLIIVFSRIN
jgi:polysaccharide export outer membrane protein